MIYIHFDTSLDGKSLICEVSGHAGQNEIGKDIVCSASSILAYTLAQAITDMQVAKRLRKKPTIFLNQGKAKIVCKPLKANFDEAAHAFLIIQRGYELLAENYPQYVTLTKFGRDI